MAWWPNPSSPWAGHLPCTGSIYPALWTRSTSRTQGDLIHPYLNSFIYELIALLEVFFFFLELGRRVGSTVNVWFTFAKCLCLLIRPRGAYSTTPILIGKNELKRWILCKTNKLWLIDHGKVSDSCKKRYRELILVSSFCLWVNVHPPLLMILFGCYREV